MRWFPLFLFLVVGLGLLIHGGVELPYLHWVGHLPGDLIVQKGGIALYLPLTSAFLFSVVLSFLLHLLFG